MPQFDPEFAPPPYSDLDEANKEIRRLQRAMFQANLKVANAIEKGELTKRSLVGTIKALEAQIRALKGEHEDPEDSPRRTSPRNRSGGGGWSL
jgi:hypothetical protein